MSLLMRKILISVLSVSLLGIVFNCTSVTRQNAPIDTQKIHIQREWMLVSLGNFTKADLMKQQTKIDLTVKQEEGKIRGGAYMGCNNMSFTAEFKNNGEVKILGLLSTMKAC